MTLYLVVPLLAATTIVQTTIVPSLAIWGVFADLPLLIVVSWSLQRGATEGTIWGFIAGVAVDLLSGAPTGAATLAMLAVGYLSGLGEATVFRARIALPLVTMFLATILYNLVFLLVVRVSGHPVVWLASLLHLVLPTAALNTVLIPIVFPVMRRLNTRLGRKEIEW